MRIGISVVCIMVFACFSYGQSRSSICEIQEYDSEGLSPLVGESSVVRGCVTFPPGYIHPDYTSFYIAREGCGVNVFCFDHLGFHLDLGDSVEVAGRVEEYISHNGTGAHTEIFVSTPDCVSLLSTGHPEPIPQDLSNSAVQQEVNEGRLLRAWGIVSDLDGDWSMYIWDGDAYLNVYRSYSDSVSFAEYDLGDTLRVTGILYQYDRTAPYFGGYELIPRFQRDIVRCSHPVAVLTSTWGGIKALYRDHPGRPPN